MNLKKRDINFYSITLADGKEEAFHLLQTCHTAQVELEGCLRHAEDSNLDLMPVSILELINRIQGAILESIDLEDGVSLELAKASNA